MKQEIIVINDRDILRQTYDDGRIFEMVLRPFVIETNKPFGYHVCITPKDETMEKPKSENLTTYSYEHCDHSTIVSEGITTASIRYYLKDGSHIDVPIVGELLEELNNLFPDTMTNKQMIQNKQVDNLINQAVLDMITPSVFLGQISQLRIPITLEELDQYIIPTGNEEGRVALMVALIDKNLLDVDDKLKKIILKQRK